MIFRALIFCSVLFCSIFFISIMAVAVANAAPTLKTKAKKEMPQFIIGVEELHYYPQYDYDSKGAYKGLAREILDLYASKRGYKFSYRVIAVAHLFQSLIRKEIDFKYPDNPYWQADIKEGANIVYSDEVVAYVDGLMVKPENKLMDIAQVKNISIPRGFTPNRYQELIKSGQINLIESNSFDSVLQLAISGRADGAYFSKAVAEYQLKKNKQEGKLVFSYKLPHTKSAYFLSTAKHPQMMQDFNRFLEEEKREISHLKSKYEVEL
ncbi:MAG: transporter substrate-binding domain-containing protein [Oligoflexia bacterium]|nr:transporter substrate-binding domain-containing protein [Oligoflexia bacterium]